MTPISLKLLLPYFETTLTQPCGLFWDYRAANVTGPPGVCAHERLDWTLTVLAHAGLLLLCVFVTAHKNPCGPYRIRHWGATSGRRGC